MTQRDRIVLGVLAVVALLAGFWITTLKPRQAELSTLDEQISQQSERLAAAEQRGRTAESARRRYRRDYTVVARLGKAVPADDQTSSLVYGIETTADRHEVDFRMLKVAASGSAAPAPAPAPAAASGSAGAAQPTAAAAAVLPPGSTVGPAGFPTLPFSFRFDGSFFRMERFLSALERNTTTTATGEDVSVRGRLFTIDGVLVKASRKGFPRIEATLAATAYVLPPGEAGVTAGATPAGPAAATGANGTPATTPAAPKAPSTTASLRGVTP